MSNINNDNNSQDNVNPQVPTNTPYHDVNTYSLQFEPSVTTYEQQHPQVQQVQSQDQQQQQYQQVQNQNQQHSPETQQNMTFLQNPHAQRSSPVSTLAMSDIQQIAQIVLQTMQQNISQDKMTTPPPVKSSLQSPTQPMQGISEPPKPAQTIPLPGYNMDEYKGKTFLCEFLQYMQKQKKFLYGINIQDQQRKQLLNSRLPTYISNSASYMVYDNNTSFVQYVEWVCKTFGPKPKTITEQLMNAEIGRYEDYGVYANKVFELGTFAQLNDSQLIFILNLKLPKHLTASLRKYTTFNSYKQGIEIVKEQGWFETIDEQYRQNNLKRPQKRDQNKDKIKGKREEGRSEEEGKGTSAGAVSLDHKQSEQQETSLNSAVATITNFENNILTYANDNTGPAQNTRAKRQHVDVRNEQQNPFIPPPNIGPIGSSAQHAQNPQPQNFQDTTQNNQNVPEANNNINDILNKLNKGSRADNVQKLLEKIAQNMPSDTKAQVKGKRGKVLQPKEPEKKRHFFTGDPNYYVNDQGQINFNSFLQDFCLPIPVATFMNLIGQQIVPKFDQTIQRNAAYISNTDNINNTLQQTGTNIFQELSTGVYKQDGNKQNNITSSDINNVYSQDQQVEQVQQAIQNYLQVTDGNNQQKEKIKKNTFQSCMNNVESKQHFCVPVFINEVKIVGILDIGAQTTLMSLQAAQRAKIDHLIQKQSENTKGVFVTGCTGQERMYGIIERLTVTLEGEEVIWDNILIQQNTTFDLLIGLDLHHLFKIQICFETQRASFQPYPDEGRKFLTLCDPQSQEKHQAKACNIRIYSAYVSNYDQQQSKQTDVIEYLQNIEHLYPNFPINKQYQLLLLDPAWLYSANMFQKTKRPPYSCLSFKDLKMLPIQTIANLNGSIILIWATGTHLYQCLELITHWGFKYINIFIVWKKITKNGEAQYGIGYYTSGVYEYLLMGTKGKVGHFRRPRNSQTTVRQSLETIEVSHQRDKFFSRKPAIVYELIQKIFTIEAMSCIELFATQRCEQNQNYDLYGNALTPYFQEQTKFQKACYQYDQNVALAELDNSQAFQPSVSNIKSYVTQNEIDQFCDQLQLGQDISVETKKSLKNLIQKFKSIFKFTNELTYTNLGEVDVNLKPHSKPVRMKPYKVVGEAYSFLLQKFEDLEKNGLVSKGASEWGTAVMCVPKDSPIEKFRAVQNFKQVNNLTEKDKYPLRLIDTILMNLSNQKYFCVLDMRGGFNQVRRAEKSKHIMAMILPFGQYIPNVMFFGETNAPSVFQRLVDLAIGDLYGKGIECYIDDIVAHGNTEEEVLERLEQLFKRLEKANFKLHPEKCTFFVQKANILGHEVCGSTISPKQKKVTKLLNLKTPQTHKQLQQFMGSINYYRKFIPNLSTIFLPLQQSLKSKGKLLWDTEQIKAYEIINQFLKEKLILHLPDQSKQFTILIYYTNVTYAAALLQSDTNGEYVVAFQSKMCIENKSNVLQSFLREIDCMCWAISEWRYLIQHQTFKIKANYQALKFLYETKTKNIQILNYQLQLQDLIFEIESISESRLKSLLLQTFLKNRSEQIEDISKGMQSLPLVDYQSTKKQKLIAIGSSFNDFEIIMQFDGASQSAQFKQQIGTGAFALFNNQKEILHKEALIFPGAQTNNCAEYYALIGGLKFLINTKRNRKKILIQGDSQLVIRQITYVYMCNSDNLNQLCFEARNLLKQFSNVVIEHIDRSFNRVCDSLAKHTLQEQIKIINSTPQVYIANLERELDEIYCQKCLRTQPEDTMLLCDHCNSGYHKECIQLENIPEGDWYCPICLPMIQERLESQEDIDPVEDFELFQILNEEKVIGDFNEKSQIRLTNRVTQYVLIQNSLFKICSNGLREVPTVGERINITEQVHQLIGHLGINRTVSLIKENYYWPKMNQQIENILRACTLCQAQRPQYLNMPSVFPINKLFRPMQALFIDCVYLPRTTQGHTMAIIAICGMSKWVEAKPIFTNNSQETADFLYDDIICRYGCPSVVRTDRGVEFMGNFKRMCERLGIIHIFSSPYYPQANGQVERMNQTIKNGLVKLSNSLQNQEYEWSQLLQQVLMGIRFTVSRPTKYSPFQLLFGCDPIIPGFQQIHKQITLEFPSESQQNEFLVQKLRLKQQLYMHTHSNLQEMEREIDETIRDREKISPSNLQFGNLVYVKREVVQYPQTKAKGPYIFLQYTDEYKTNAILIRVKDSKISRVNITKISPLRIF